MAPWPWPRHPQLARHRPMSLCVQPPPAGCAPVRRVRRHGDAALEDGRLKGGRLLESGVDGPTGKNRSRSRCAGGRGDRTAVILKQLTRDPLSHETKLGNHSLQPCRRTWRPGAAAVAAASCECAIDVGSGRTGADPGGGGGLRGGVVGGSAPAVYGVC